MSKKNKLSTRKKLHTADLEREKARQTAKTLKANAKIEKKKNTMTDVNMTKKKKTKGLKLRKNVVVKGIRIRSAADKEKIRELIAEEEDNKMAD
mmetsp:Transcript_22257/g.26746  ORF Transcript_22257/g.26746 Transcript_22257/m.26746 type:complete len:94 (+) Transcript_22257:130-411(+)|eukprot:CAMPEP_0197854226 /NCGR_PEP_ID=MMETSP1438-20131217/24295_1 /TAXON_ID=1461541 /ORGANISM="Pterosperma sp., Strain CCMP1384" /LENGTH=93 /DNA_ID=CAMNT_0043468893 /DNA_START=130 /DNA_END=411 /DNA_ORIENTATION=+